MKLKDLPDDENLVGKKLKNGGVIVSGWPKGLWFKMDLKSQQIFPMTFRSYEEMLDADILA